MVKFGKLLFAVSLTSVSFGHDLIINQYYNMLHLVVAIICQYFTQNESFSSSPAVTWESRAQPQHTACQQPQSIALALTPDIVLKQWMIDDFLIADVSTVQQREIATSAGHIMLHTSLGTDAFTSNSATRGHFKLLGFTSCFCLDQFNRLDPSSVFIWFSCFQCLLC